jgi:hypothetical protein
VDPASIRCIRQSSAYRELHPYFAGTKPPLPSDFWNEDDKEFLVFDLMPSDKTFGRQAMILFMIKQEEYTLLVARLIIPDDSDNTVDIIDMYNYERD